MRDDPRWLDPGQPGFRDAMHVPFVFVTCETELQPGDKCSLRHDDKCVKWSGKPEGNGIYEYKMTVEAEPMWHGVADPFRESPIPANEPFPVFIRRECFTRMRHDFEIEVHDRGGTSTCHLVCDIW